jgi:N,N'-diacetyllegionaminate synthase
MKFDIIAEIGQAHEGSVGIAHSYIDAMAKAGVNAIKFQTHIAEAESSVFEPFRVKFSYEDNTRYDYWKRMEFSEEQWIGLKAHCDDVGIEFLSSPFSLAAIDLLERVGVKRYKVGSGEVNNHLMLEYLAKTGKPVLLSSGMSSFEELDSSVALLKNFETSLSIFQCTTSYPTKPENWGLNVIHELKQRYGVPVGYSDHSGDMFACLFAASQGAELFEFHVVFDKSMFGPDANSSLTPKEVSKLVTGLRQYEQSLLNPVDKSSNSQFSELKGIFEKSLAVNKDLPVGHVLRMEDLETKKPRGKGINAAEFQNILGARLARPMSKWEFLNKIDLDEK